MSPKRLSVGGVSAVVSPSGNASPLHPVPIATSVLEDGSLTEFFCVEIAANESPLRPVYCTEVTMIGLGPKPKTRLHLSGEPNEPLRVTRTGISRSHSVVLCRQRPGKRYAKSGGEHSTAAGPRSVERAGRAD